MGLNTGPAKEHLSLLLSSLVTVAMNYQLDCVTSLFSAKILKVKEIVDHVVFYLPKLIVYTQVKEFTFLRGNLIPIGFVINVLSILTC